MQRASTACDHHRLGKQRRQNLGLSPAKAAKKRKNIYPNSRFAQIDGRLTAEAAEATENEIQNNHSALSASAVNIFLSSSRSEKD
jgi:hypothetical protein